MNEAMINTVASAACRLIDTYELWQVRLALVDTLHGVMVLALFIVLVIFVVNTIVREANNGNTR